MPPTPVLARTLATAAVVALVSSTGGVAVAAPNAPVVHNAPRSPAVPDTGATVGATGRTYVVAPGGNDAGSGTRTSPWRTLKRASTAPLKPGDRVLLQRGATYEGGLTIAASGTADAPILVAGTGVGAPPIVQHDNCVRLTGSYVEVNGLDVRSCTWAGVSLEGAHETLRNSTVSGNVVGVHVTEQATDATVSRNLLTRNQRLSPGKDGTNDDSGANGVAVQGTRTLISGNTISGHYAASPDYGVDGSAVEVFGARDTRIVANSSTDNSTFVELGDRSTDDTVISRNTVTSSIGHGYFVVTRGAGDTSFGPVMGTTVDHNSVAMNGASDGGLICYGGCSPAILEASDNIIMSRTKPTWSDGQGMGGANNVLVDDSDPRTARPLFVDRTRDLRLVRASPAVDSAGSCWQRRDVMRPSTALGYGAVTCRDGNGDGLAALDIGALER